MNGRGKPTWISWLAITLILIPVLYVASFGPACWMTSRTGTGAGLLPRIYAPLIRLWNVNPRFVGRGLNLYSAMGAAAGWEWSISEDYSRWGVYRTHWGAI